MAASVGREGLPGSPVVEVADWRSCWLFLYMTFTIACTSNVNTTDTATEPTTIYITVVVGILVTGSEVVVVMVVMEVVAGSSGVVDAGVGGLLQAGKYNILLSFQCT